MPPGPRDQARLHITVLSPDGAKAAARGLGPWLARVAPGRARGEVTVALVSDTRMRSLNRTFRGADHATDVLSFPVAAPAPAAAGTALGDIAIATGVATRQARAAGHALGTELRVLALHGLLHLLGFDHDTDDGRMARTEQTLRRQGGLPKGLIERKAPARRGAPAPPTARARR